MLSEAHLVEIFKALADPNRLHLFELLLYSDRTNSELMNETGLSQNLLSHHLNVLTETNLIKAHKSIGDARRRYYSPNLNTTQALALWWRGHGLSPQEAIPTLKTPRRVLFLCQQNAARSLIAEALAHHMAPGSLIASSAGIQSRDELPEAALHVLREYGLPTGSLKSQTYESVLHQSFDFLVTVCDRVHEMDLPVELADLAYVHWSLLDPGDESDDPDVQLELTRKLAAEIVQRLVMFVQQLAAQEAAAE